jgi:hypothetical protein
MHHLEMPEAFAGAGVEGEKAIAEKVCARAVGAIEIVFWAGGGNVDDAAFFIEREFAPGVGAADRFPGVFRPGVVAEFAFMRNGMEDPTQSAGANVEGADVSGCGTPALIGGGTEYEQVFKNTARRGGLNEAKSLADRGLSLL